MRDGPFRCLSLSPIGLGTPDIAVATARAGGVGLLDVEFCRDWEGARVTLDRALAVTDGEIGLRMRGVSAAGCRPLLDQLAE